MSFRSRAPVQSRVRAFLFLFGTFCMFIILGMSFFSFFAGLDLLSDQFLGSVLRIGAPITLDSGGNDVGVTSVVDTTTTGLPVIASIDETAGTLRIFVCSTVTCSALTANATGLGSQVLTQHLAMALDSTNVPVYAFWNGNNLDLVAGKCSDSVCSVFSANAVDAGGSNLGQYVDIVLSAANLPRISYYDATDGDLKIAICDDVECAGLNDTLLTLDSGGDVGLYTSISLDSNGYPVVAYYDATNGNFKTAWCGTSTCSAGNVVSTVSSTGDVGMYTDSLASRNFNGGGVYAFYDATNADVVVMQCSNPICAAPTSTQTIDANDFSGDGISLSVDANDFPVLSYTSRVGGRAKFVHCNDLACAGGDDDIMVLDSVSSTGDTSVAMITPYTYGVSYYDAGLGDLRFSAVDLSASTLTVAPFDVDNGGAYGQFTSMVLSGVNPVIVYDAGSNIGVTLCSDVNCAGSSSNQITVQTAKQTDVRLSGLGMPVIAFVDSASSDLTLVVCSDPACADDNETERVVYAGTVSVPSLLLDGLDNPILGFRDGDLGDFFILYCNDTVCDGVGETTTPIDVAAVPDGPISMVLDGGGNVVALYEAAANAITVVHCNDATCSAPVSNVPDASGTAVLGNHSLALNGSGFPVFAYSDGNEISVIACSDVNCAASSQSTFDLEAPSEIAFGLDSSYRPFIVVSETTRHHYYVIHCNDAACSGSNEDIMVAHDGAGAGDDFMSPSLLLGASNRFMSAYYNETTTALGFMSGTYNDPPVVSFNSVVERGVGSAVVDISVAVSDSNADPTWLRVDYDTDNGCDGPWSTATIDSISGTFSGSVAPTPSFRTLEQYQVGAGNRVITTSTNTVQFDWLSGVDLPTSTSTHCLRVIPNDGVRGSVATTTVTLANTSIPGDSEARMVLNGTVVDRLTAVLDSSNFPVITYYDSFNSSLSLLRCDDAYCVGGGETVNSLPASDTYLSMALDGSGFAVVAAIQTNGADRNLQFIHCTNSSCSTSTSNSVETSVPNVWGISLQWDAIAIRPVMSYYQDDNTVVLTRCNDPDCAGADEVPQTVDAMVGVTGAGGTSLVLDSSRFPVISYYDTANRTLKFVHCSTLTCSAGAYATLDNGGGINDVGFTSSIQLNASLNPVVAYMDTTSGNIKLATCTDTDCTGNSTATIGFTYTSLSERSLSLVSDVPRVTAAGSVDLIACDDATCAGPSSYTFESASGFSNSSLTMSGGVAVGYYPDPYNFGIRLAKASINSEPLPPSGLGPVDVLNGTIITTSTPTFTFTTSDPDLDSMTFRIQIDDATDFVSPVVDYTSGSEAGGAKSFTVGQAAGTGAYAVGEAGQTFEGVNYYWRVRVNDGTVDSTWAPTLTATGSFSYPSGGRTRPTSTTEAPLATTSTTAGGAGDSPTTAGGSTTAAGSTTDAATTTAAGTTGSVTTVHPSSTTGAATTTTAGQFFGSSVGSSARLDFAQVLPSTMFEVGSARSTIVVEDPSLFSSLVSGLLATSTPLSVRHCLVGIVASNLPSSVSTVNGLLTLLNSPVSTAAFRANTFLDCSVHSYASSMGLSGFYSQDFSFFPPLDAEFIVGSFVDFSPSSLEGFSFSPSALFSPLSRSTFSPPAVLE